LLARPPDRGDARQAPRAERRRRAARPVTRPDGARVDAARPARDLGARRRVEHRPARAERRRARAARLHRRRARRDRPLRDRERGLEAVERAEQRLADGTYGLSVESGAPIPDERLEAQPTAERTAEEETRFERGA